MYFRKLAVGFCFLGAGLGFSNNLYAGCDPCIQSAAQSANTTMTNAINQVASSVQSNVNATNVLNNTVSSASTVLQQTINLTNQNLLQALSASTNRIELSVQQTSQVITNTTDHTVQSIVQALKEQHIAEMADRQLRTYDQSLAQPFSGDIGANRAPLLKQGLVQADQIWQNVSNDMYEWNNATGAADGGGQSIVSAMLLTEEDEVWNPLPLVTKRQITEDESLNLQKLLTLMVNPVPLKAMNAQQLATNGDAAEYELNRRLNNAKLELAHSVLARSLADKYPIIPISTDDWQQGYITSEPDPVTEKVSIMSMLESETIGRLGSDGWYLDVKTLTDAGILREQVYQNAIGNQLLLKMLEQEEQELTMLALLALSKLEKNKPTPP